MAGVITTGNHPKALWPGMRDFFGADYNEHPKEYTELFEIETSKQNYEEESKVTGFGQAPLKSEGQPVSYDSESAGYTKRYTHNVWGLGYIVTQEELEDNLYEKVSRRRIKRLSFSMRQTKETVCANVYNRAFTSGYTGGDGIILASASHPTTIGNQSNLLTAADFSEAALEDACITIGLAKNERGHFIGLKPMKLIHPVNIQFDVARVLKSELTPGTANNAVNAVRLVGVKPVCNHYLSDTDAWFIKTDCPNGMTMYERRALDLTRDSDFDTENAKAKATMRFSVGWTDWLSVFSNPGV